MGEYAERFAENCIDASVLRDLTDQDLEKIGIPLGHRKKYRHGKIRYYYRRDGKQIALPFEPGTTELQQA
jgi:hypothetical protein